MPTSSEIIQRRSLFAAQGTRRYKRSGCIGIGDRFTSESVIGIPRIAQGGRVCSVRRAARIHVSGSAPLFAAELVCG